MARTTPAQNPRGFNSSKFLLSVDTLDFRSLSLLSRVHVPHYACV